MFIRTNTVCLAGLVSRALNGVVYLYGLSALEHANMTCVPGWYHHHICGASISHVAGRPGPIEILYSWPIHTSLS